MVDSILQELEHDQPIVLVGDPGVGKTWMAEEIRSKITTSFTSFQAYLWISLNKKYNSNLHEEVAYQLSINTGEEWKQYFQFKDEKEEECLKAKIRKRLAKMTSTNHESKKSKTILAILDGASNDLIVDGVVSKLKALLPQSKQNSLRFIIIKRSDHETISDSTGIEKKKVLKIEPLSNVKALDLLQTVAGNRAVEKNQGVITQFGEIFNDDRKTISLPAAVVVGIAKALKKYSIEKQDVSPIKTLKSALEEAKTSNMEVAQSLILRSWCDMLPSNDVNMINCCWYSRELLKHSSVHYNELISNWIIEGYLDSTDQINKAYEQGHRILMELLDYGMLKIQEDDFVSVEVTALNACDYRYDEFGKRERLGLAKVLEDCNWQGLGELAPADGAMKTICNHIKGWGKVRTLLTDGSRLCEEAPDVFSQPLKELQVLMILSPRFNSLEFLSCSLFPKLHLLVLRGCNMLKKIDHIKQLSLLTVLEISGAESLKKVPDDVFDQMHQLRSLNLSGTQILSLPSSFSNLTELRWLILRGCLLFEKLPRVKEMKSLEVIDLSGSLSFKKFKDKALDSFKRLEILDFSYTQIKCLPYLKNLQALTRLSLEGCTSLVRLPKLENLPLLQILDLSTTYGLKEIHAESLEHKEDLRVLNLSKSGIVHLPSSLSCLSHLVSLDLSNASCLVNIEKISFDNFTCLRCLNLSNTKFKNLSSLSQLSNLRELHLRNCQSLEELPEMKGLTRLEILDFSGASLLKKIPEQSLGGLKNLRQLVLSDCVNLKKLSFSNVFEKLEVLNVSGCQDLTVGGSIASITSLQLLNLSETKVECLPSLSNSCRLRQLLLRNCIGLKEIPLLESLSELQELNLVGATSLREIDANFLENMSQLKTLNLSQTQVNLLSNVMSKLTNLTNLRELSLNNCSLDYELNLEKLTTLEVLDFSHTKVRRLHSLENLCNLQQLLLRGCSELVLPNLERLTKLQTLDLWGTKIEEFPYWISELKYLKRLDLPDLNGIHELDCGKIKHLPEELNWKECGIKDINALGSRSFLSLSSEFMEKDAEIWRTILKNFNIAICPSIESGKNEDIYFLKDMTTSEDIYFKSMPFPKNSASVLEIRGSKIIPAGLDDIIMQTEYLSLIGNKSIRRLSDLAGGSIEAMKGLRLEKCDRMDNLFSDDVKVGKNFESLWVLNLPKLKSMYSTIIAVQSFKNLLQLYLDCCPMLQNVFSPWQMPERLEILHIKFCYNLETISNSKASEECKMQKLRMLKLIQLPELVSLGVRLPSLEKATVRGCPKLKNFEEALVLGSDSVEITSFAESWDRTKVQKEIKKILRSS